MLLRSNLDNLASAVFTAAPAKTKGPPIWAALSSSGEPRAAVYGADELQCDRSPWPKLEEKM